jgi:putative hydrolase of the HAD superfamily
MSTLEALTIDLDDTLLDLSGLGGAIDAACGVVAATSDSLSKAKLRLANALVWERLWPLRELDWALGRLTGADLTLEVWSETLEACHANDQRLAVLAASTHLAAMRESVRLYDDARDLLADVAVASVPIALITNGASDTQREKLRAVGIEGAFDAVIISGELGSAKPDTLPFEMAIQALGVDGRSVWHIGDSLASDVAGANGAGLASVWLNRDGNARPAGAPTPDVEIRSLSELPRQLRG